MTALVLLLMACGGEEPECSEEIACGFGEVCVEGTCRGKTCATSAQCDMESTCTDGKCVAGCAEDADCYPGDFCDLEVGSCTAAACRDSHLDCDFSEFCNFATGECYEAAGYYCGACVDDDDCGGNGNLCLNLGYTGGYFCGVTCENNADCPAGYTCSGVQDRTGNLIGYQCITYCWLYDDERRAAAPPPLTPVAVDATTAQRVGGSR